MRNPEPTVTQGLEGPLRRPWKLLAAWCLRRHEDRHLGSVNARQPSAGTNRLPAGQGRGGRRVSYGRRMDAASPGLAAKEEHAQGVDEHDMCARVVLCLAALSIAVLPPIDRTRGAPVGHNCSVARCAQGTMKGHLPLSMWGFRSEGGEQCSRSEALVSGLNYPLCLLKHMHA
jgi:hypothetical protein